MARSLVIVSCVLLGLAAGCDTSERLARLEKQNQELQAEAKSRQATANYDLQAKCGKDARAWFNQNWSRDKDTILLDFTNHYNKSLNKCFVLVEYHYNSKFGGVGDSSWTNDMTLTDVYENSKYGTFTESHMTSYTPSPPKRDTRAEVITCQVLDQKCKTGDEFNGLLRPYMNN